MSTIDMDNIEVDRIIEMCWEDRIPFLKMVLGVQYVLDYSGVL